MNPKIYINLQIAPKDFLLTVTPTTNPRPITTDSISVRTSKYLKLEKEKDLQNKKIYPKTMKHIQSNFVLPKVNTSFAE